MTWWRRPRVTAAVVVLAGVVLALVATRHGPRLSPDSITYLSVAEHVRHGRGLVDFTDQPFSVFPPVFPLVLAPFGAALWWARVVNVLALAATGALLHHLLVPRVRGWVAAAAVLTVMVCQGTVTVAGSTFSEPLFVAVALAAIAVLGARPITVRRAALVGVLAGLGFLTRYAGVALVGAVVVAALAAGWPERRGDRRWWLPSATIAAAASVVSGAWLLRNLVVAGQPMGPRWSGGANERIDVLLWRPFESIGTLLVGEGRVAARTAGVVAVLVLVAALVLVARRRPWQAVDVAMLLFGAASIVVPVVARAMTASDVSGRVVWPALPCVAFAAAMLLDAVAPRVPVAVVAVVLAGALVWTGGEGVATAVRWANLPGSGDRDVYAPALHDMIDALPAGTLVLTNNPWGVWWQHRAEPTLMAFVRPRAGNSHLPIDAVELRRRVCDGPVVLAWFTGLQNAGEGPRERRPDLLQVVDLRLVRRVSNGELYDVTPLDPAECAVSG